LILSGRKEIGDVAGKSEKDFSDYQLP